MTMETAALDLEVFQRDEHRFGGVRERRVLIYWPLPPNPLAAPTADPDGDGQTNLFEYTAGVIPNDSASRFTLTLAPVPGQPVQTNVIFTPRLTDRTYTVTLKTDLTAATWTPLPGGIVTDAGAQRTVTDTAATGTKKFYHVEITKP